MPNPDNAAAVEFLERWAPGGPWVLTAIALDKKTILTRTFSGETRSGLGAWLREYNGQFNLYFHVNPTIGPLSKKAERTDIAAVAWLHVDVDPRANEDLATERKRALELLTGARLPQSVPPPTVVVFSGGGYQGFWKLAEPVAVNGDLQLAEDAKRYNQQLELLFGADNCHNIDRIMRLPGTINIPDLRKQKKGRSAELARVILFDETRVYPITAFTPAPSTQLGNNGGFSGAGGAEPGNVARLASVDELDEWSVPDRVKVIIVQGRHPDQPKEGDNSRSAWVFDVVCNLLRCQVPENVIYSILTDPDFGISESILETKTSAGRVAMRQIERARDEVEDPWLRKLNEQFAVIGNMGGKCRVIEEMMDHGLNRTRFTKQSFEDFRNRFMHKTIPIGTDSNGNVKQAPVGKWWLGHPRRCQYETIVFAPQRETPGAYNLWKGFACVSNPAGACGLFLDHVKRNVCSGNPDYFRYLIGWMARAVQRPAAPGEVAVVLRGGRGTGKSVFAREFGKLFGRHFLQVSNSGHLVGNFNAHLRDVVVLFADEAFYAGDRRHASVLKTLITEETIPIEAKGVDVETSPNYVHLIMASNETHVIPAGGDERRFFMLDVGNGNQKDHEFFKALLAQLDNGGREALLHQLLTHSLDGFEVRAVPRTAALQEQKLLSLNADEEWWYQKLLEGRLLPGHSAWERTVVKDALTDDYVNNTKRFNIIRRGSATSLGRFLHKVIPGLRAAQLTREVETADADGWSGKRVIRAYHYLLPTLEVCRNYWNEQFGADPWPVAVTEDGSNGLF